MGVFTDYEIQIDVYDGDGVLLVSDSVLPAAGTAPEWTADLGDDCPTCDWTFDFANEDTDFLTFRFIGTDFSKTYVYVPNYGPTTATFWLPSGGSQSEDIRFEILGGVPEVKAKGNISAIPFEDVFTGSYVHPYDATYFCSQTTCPSLWYQSVGFFLSPVDYIPNSTNRTFTFAPEANSEYHESWNAVWDVPNLKLEFHPQRKFLVKGDLDATDVTFTSEDPNTGWGGISFEPGSGGSLHNSVIDHVASGYASFSLRITNASPEIAGTRIFNPTGAGVGGIYISGSSATPTLEGNTIESTDWTGAYVTSNARPRFVQNVIQDNQAWGIIAGFGTDPFLSPPVGSTPGPGFFGNIIQVNDQGGVSASMSAYVTFGWYYYPSGFHADGFNSVVNNGGVGLTASTSATVAAGNTSNNKMNRIFGNATNDATATGSGSRVWARCDWWNDTTPPFRTSESGGGLVYDDYYLLQDPYVNPDATCVSGAGLTQDEGSSTELAALGTAPGDSRITAREMLAVAAELVGPDPELGLDALSQLVENSNDEEVLSAALSEAGFLAARLDVRQETREQAMTMLHESAASSKVRRRSASLRSLVAAQYRRGESAQAIASAESLVAGALLDEDRLYGYVALAHLYAEEGRGNKAASSLAAAEAFAPTSVEVEIARFEVDRLSPNSARRRSGSIVDANSKVNGFSGKIGGSAVNEQMGTESDERVFQMLPLFPNPVLKHSAVNFVLREPALVQLDLYDLIGRRVGFSVRGRYGIGRHTERFDVSRLPAGAYLLRATARPDDSGAQTSTVGLIVVR